MSTTPPLFPDIASPEVAKAAVDLTFGLAERWQLSRPELDRLLGIRSTSTLDNSPETFSFDTLERIRHLLHIYRSPQQLLPEDQANQWVRHPKHVSPFLGKTAPESMLQGQVRHLLDTHHYLQVAQNDSG